MACGMKPEPLSDFSTSGGPCSRKSHCKARDRRLRRLVRHRQPGKLAAAGQVPHGKNVRPAAIDGRQRARNGPWPIPLFGWCQWSTASNSR